MPTGTRTAAIAGMDVSKDGADRFTEVKGHSRLCRPEVAESVKTEEVKWQKSMHGPQRS